MRLFKIDLPSRHHDYKVDLSPRRYDYNIDLPGRVVNAQLWIKELLLRDRMSAASGIVVKAIAKVFMQKNAHGLSGIRVGGLSNAPTKTVGIKPHSGVAIGDTVRLSSVKRITSAESGIRAGGVVGKGVQLIMPRPLSDLDGLDIGDIDDMSLAELDYKVIQTW